MTLKPGSLGSGGPPPSAGIAGLREALHPTSRAFELRVEGPVDSGICELGFT